MSGLDTYFHHQAENFEDTTSNVQREFDSLEDLADYYNENPIIDLLPDPNRSTLLQEPPSLYCMAESTVALGALMTPTTSYDSEKSSCWSGDAISLPSRDFGYQSEALNGDAPEFSPNTSERDNKEPALNPNAPEFVPVGYEAPAVEEEDADDEIMTLARLTLQYQINRVKEQLRIFMNRLAADDMA